MLLYENYSNILRYFDKELWKIKVDKDGISYYELVVDEYFENSVLSIDYINIEELFKKMEDFLLLRISLYMNNI